MVLKQRPPLLVTVSTAVLLVLGGAAAYFGLGQRLAATTKPPAAMKLVPKQAIATLTLSTDETQWRRLRQLGTPESQKLLDKFLVTWRDRIITANGYRFRTDIRPWIGDQVTVAFLPGQQEAAELMLIVPIEQPLKAQELLAEPQDAVSWVGRDYKNAKIQSVTAPTGETFESTVLANKWLVLASSAGTIEAVVDSFDGGSSMADVDAYRQAIKHLKMPSALMQIYVDPPTAAGLWAGNDMLPEINGLVAAADLLPNGLDIEASTWLGPEDQPVYRDMKNSRAWAPRRLPESTVLMMSTGSVGPTWQALQDADQLNALLPVSAEALARGLKRQTGLDFENDILPWLGGEMALALLPPEETGSASIGQVALMADVSDRAAAEATWAQLDEVISNRFRFNVTSPETEAQPVNRLVSYQGGVAMGHGWLDQDVTFFGIGTEVLDAIAPRPNRALQGNQAFQTLLKLSPQENNGYFFLDLERIEDLQGTLPFPTLPDGVFFSAVKSIGVTTTVQDEKTLGYDIFVELPKGRRVRPLASGSISQTNSEEKAE